MPTCEELTETLKRIDGRGYKAYRDIRDRFDFPECTLYVDHIQADPFAAPSHMRIRIPMQIAKLPPELWQTRVRRIGLEDFLAREVRSALRSATRAGQRSANGRRGARVGSGHSGAIQIDAGGQAVLERAAVRIDPQWVEARIQVGLPASGRTILGRAANELLRVTLPTAAFAGLTWKSLPERAAIRFVECVENQEYIRDQLDSLGLVAFVANGSILPRRSGANDLAMQSDLAVPFRSPERYELEIELPNPVDTLSGTHHSLEGMGIPKGVTLIVGGGYHGKSTLLQALERGVYPHIPGDGREGVVCSRDAVKIRAEDGRFVGDVNIEAFISDLPRKRSTRYFSTHDASGSTSQASNIVEATELGATTLLLDEDTSATNFMVRDARMQALVSKQDEPITPFIDRVRELYQTHGVSTVLVMGGVGDYFAVADHVIAMRDYQPFDVTAEARRITEEYTNMRREEAKQPMQAPSPRIPLASSFDSSRGRREVKIDARGRDMLIYGTEPIDLRCVPQIEDRSQVLAVGYAIHLASKRLMDGRRTLREVLEELDRFLDENGVDALSPFRSHDEHPGNFARPRRFEIAAAINRLRSLRVESD